MEYTSLPRVLEKFKGKFQQIESFGKKKEIKASVNDID
jgi:fructose 1,6-bisphosphatase